MTIGVILEERVDDDPESFVTPGFFDSPTQCVEVHESDFLGPGRDKSCAAFTAAAESLERDGARLIIADCSYAVVHQAAVAARVPNCTVALSVLSLLPSMCELVAPDRKLGVITATASGVESVLPSIEGHDRWSDRLDVIELAGTPFDENGPQLRGEERRRALSEAAAELGRAALERNPSITAILVSCTAVPLYSDFIRKATGLPVVDTRTMVNALWRSLSPQ